MLKSRGGLPGFGEDQAGHEALNPQSQKVTELKIEIEEESGCVLLKFLVKERRDGEIVGPGGKRENESEERRFESSSPESTQGPNRHHATVQPLLTPPHQPASVSSVRLKHETKTKHSQGHTIETPRNGHA